MVYETRSPEETEKVGQALAEALQPGAVIAFEGDLGAGKTAFTRGLARGMGIDCHVSSPTFALVHNYGGQPPLIHFDMYRVTGWDDLYSTGYFDYLDAGAILVVEWSENVEAALPADAIRIRIQQAEENVRLIERVG